MNPSEIALSYDALADHWDSSKFNRENGINQHLRALRFSPNKSGHAIDIGCGSSGRIIELLIEHGFQAEGLDISAGMLEHAKRRHPEATFHQADIVTWSLPHSYQFISAWDSIWHVPLNDQQPVLEKLCDGLAPGGVLISSSGGIDEPEEGSNPFLEQPLYHAALGIPKILATLSARDCICRHLEYDEARGDEVGRHLYFIAQKRNSAK